LEDTAAMHARLTGLLRERDRDPAAFTFAHRLRFQVVADAGDFDQPCIGSPRKIADSIRHFHDVGVEHLLLAPPPGPTTAALLEQADRFANDVKPLVDDLWS
jgi:alkanesulfonate monooxygenase SsuD/methylene tetrahydromethanopterin reductase-like flavin-dependent oxidoreductase (luciferase family)